MKTRVPFIAMASLLISCEDTRPIKSVCDCENVKVFELEKKFGTLNGNTISYFEYFGLGRGFTHQLLICNPEALDSIAVSRKKVEIRFSGDWFSDCDSANTTNPKMIHVREISLYKR